MKAKVFLDNEKKHFINLKIAHSIDYLFYYQQLNLIVLLSVGAPISVQINNFEQSISH